MTSAAAKVVISSSAFSRDKRLKSLRAGVISFAISSSVLLATPAAAETLSAPPSDPTVRTADQIKRGSKETLSGLPYITDGDTVTISGTRIRLAGIDAPEMGQVCIDKAGREYRCGEAAREALTKVAAGLTWTCELLPSPDRYGRRVGACRAADHIGDVTKMVDINRWLVRAGWALDWPRYSHGRYAADQDAARVARRGMWSGAFHAPWDWRHRTCETEILGARAVPIDARDKLCR